MKEPSHTSPNGVRQSPQALFADGCQAPAPSWFIESRKEDDAVCLVIVDPFEKVPVDLIADLVEQSLAVLVLGPADDGGWRESAMAAGAFGCLSAATPEDDRVSLLRGAGRYQAARREMRLLRNHHDTLCGELVHSFGDAMEKLSDSRKDAGRIRSALEDIRLRVIRTLV